MTDMTLTKREKETLKLLARCQHPQPWTGPMKAMGNKLAKKWMADFKSGYPHGFVITDAGRSALKETTP